MEAELDIKDIKLLECIDSNKPTKEKLIELRKCLEQRANINIKDAEGNSPLHITVYCERAVMIKLLIKRGADVNGQDKYWKTPLHVAASCREPSIVKLLLNNGAELNAQDAYKNTPLHCAIESGNETVVEFLLKENADLNTRTINGKYPLHVAAKYGSIFMIKLLLNKGAHVNVTDQYGSTALHEAASSGEPSLVELLMNKGIDVNVKDMFNCTPLHSAAGAGKMSVVVLLINKGGDVNAQAVNKSTPLHEAAQSGNIDVVEYLLNEGADVNPQAPNGDTPLLRALQAKNICIAKLLLNNGANVNAQIISLDMRFESSKSPMPQSTEAFPTVNFQEQSALGCGLIYKDTPLHRAVNSGDIYIVELLLSKGANVNAQTSYGETPLLRAARPRNNAVVKLLVKKGARVDLGDINGRTPLHELVSSGDLTTVKLILNKGADVNSQNINGDTPLHLLLTKLYECLMLDKVNIGITQTRDDFTSMLSEKVSVVKLLLDEGADVNLKTKTGYTTLHIAAKYGQTLILELLLHRKADVNATTRKGYTPLHLAAERGHVSIVQQLLDKNADLNLQDKFGKTPLHNAARSQRNYVVDLLLKNGADANIRNNDGKTPLYLAAELGWTSILVQLSKVVDVTAQVTNEDTPLHAAARFGMTSTMKQMLNKNVDINVTNSHQETPLHVAVRRNQTALVTQLVRRNANVMAENNKGDTPYSYAAYFDVDEKIVSILQVAEKEAKFNIFVNNDQYENPLDDFLCNNQPIFPHNGEIEEHMYSKANNISSLHGQLYETKMASLVFIRTLNHEQLEHDFFLGVNIDGIGAMDDICLRYKVRDRQKPVVLFMQVKHREDPKERKLTHGALWNDSGDFSLKKYFESYLKIKRRFRTGNEDCIFEGKFCDINCYFVLYTSAQENLTKKKTENNQNKIMHELINTGHHIKPFQYGYNEIDIDRLVKLINDNSEECCCRAEAKDFFDSLWFYSSQAKQEKVECIVKYEINKHYNNTKHKLYNKFEFHANAIFSKAHKYIKEWWMLRGKAPYLTRSNDCFGSSKLSSLDKSLAIASDSDNKLDVINFVLRKPLIPNEFFQTPYLTALERCLDIYIKKYKSLKSPDKINNNKEHFKQLIAYNNNITGVLPSSESQNDIVFEYLKRDGTSEVGGDFFRTTILGMIHLQVANHEQIEPGFMLGNKLHGINAFNDVCLRYQVKKYQRPVILFMQLIHREDPDKCKLCDDALWSNSSDFSLLKFFQSYLKIKDQFQADNKNPMFRGKFCDVDCYFILYTSVKENFTKKKTEHKLDRVVLDLISTKPNSEAFQFSYDVMDCLTKQIALERIENIGNVFFKSILPENYFKSIKRSEKHLPQSSAEDFVEKRRTHWKPNILSDNLIAKYHVFMGREILQPCRVQVNKEYRIWEFRSDFFNSNVDYVDQLNSVLAKIITSKYLDGFTNTTKCQSNMRDDYRKILKLLEIPLPLSFGNLDMTFRGSKDKVQKRIRALADKLIGMLQLNENTKMIEINEDDVGPGKIIERGFVDINGGIGGAVGNLLVLDIESDMLKFNLNHEDLPDNAALFLEELKDKRHKPFNENLSDYKFRFNIEDFPKLSITVDYNDKARARDFLNKFWFYPDQAKVDKVELIFMETYQKYHNVIPSSVLDRTLYLTNVTQQWWIQTKESPYLTRESGFFERAELADIYDRLQSVINFMYLFSIDAIDITVRREKEGYVSEKMHKLFGKLVDNLFHLFDPQFDDRFELSRSDYDIRDKSTLSLKIHPDMEWVALTVTTITISKFKGRNAKRCFVAKAAPSRGGRRAKEKFMLYEYYSCGGLYRFKDCFRNINMDSSFC